jgi:hypothetical protein
MMHIWACLHGTLHGLLLSQGLLCKPDLKALKSGAKSVRADYSLVRPSFMFFLLGPWLDVGP